MKTLSETWFAEGRIDFELKKYTLLAYLQEINRHFNTNKLYPQLSDLVFHYNNLLAFKNNKQHLQEHFPRRLTDVRLQELQLIYEQMIADDELMEELEAIIRFSIRHINESIKDGTEIHEFVEEKMTIEPVGIVPLQAHEGYFFLSRAAEKETRVFSYRLTFFERQHEQYRGIHVQYLDSYQRSYVNTYEQIKSELIRNRSELPNPAVYSVESELSYPVHETLLPVAKRSLVKYITKMARG
jgi:hypothetical protein